MTIDLTTFESATATIDCAGQIHSIRWEAGELTAIDHGEAEPELALAALGGTNVPCLDVLASWRRHRHDHRLLTALTRGPADPSRFTTIRASQGVHLSRRSGECKWAALCRR